MATHCDHGEDVSDDGLEGLGPPDEPTLATALHG
jgi:hypothetical protein